MQLYLRFVSFSSKLEISQPSMKELACMTGPQLLSHFWLFVDPSPPLMRISLTYPKGMLSMNETHRLPSRNWLTQEHKKAWPSDSTTNATAFAWPPTTGPNASVVLPSSRAADSSLVCEAYNCEIYCHKSQRPERNLTFLLQEFHQLGGENHLSDNPSVERSVRIKWLNTLRVMCVALNHPPEKALDAFLRLRATCKEDLLFGQVGCNIRVSNGSPTQIIRSLLYFLIMYIYTVIILRR